MERYQHGKIYKIVCNITGKVYIGSTCKKLLSQRLAGHNDAFKQWKNGKIKGGITSFQILEGGNYYIELLELVPCNSKDELLIKEKFYIKNNVCVNKIKNLNRTEEEKKEHNKEYNENNKNKKNEYKKNHYQNNKDKINEYNKKYYENNKDKRKEYYENNKDKILEKTNCSYCNKEMVKGSLTIHLKNSCPNKN
jgi:flagellar biosynthesis GTPase FlhF